MVDYIKESVHINNGKVLFYGLFNDAIISRSWLNDDKTILLSTPQGGSMHTFAINTGNTYKYYKIICWKSKFLISRVKRGPLSSNYQTIS